MAAPPGVPRHVAISMDGNGRWAERRGLPREAGHEAGALSVREVVRAAGEVGVEVLTLYSFSTENWKRPATEVAALMKLLGRYLVDELEELARNRVRLTAIGQLDRLPAWVRKLLRAAEHATRNNDGLQLVLALSYGSRAEITQAVRLVAERVKRGELAPADISEADVAVGLWTAGQPDPDLLIRTSGEMRLSNFLLWQIAYSELVVTDVAWPDFRRPQFDLALAAFRARQRRFGATAAQVTR